MRHPGGCTKSRTGTPVSQADFEVLRLLVEGKADRQVAGKTAISDPTIRRHIDTIKTVLDTRTAPQPSPRLDRLIAGEPVAAPCH